MTAPSRREATHTDVTPQPHGEPGTASACFATLVLALATGLSLSSAARLLPHPGEDGTPYLGV